MPSSILGKKLGMTQIFEEGGRVTPVTVIAAGPCVVTQLKTIAKDGYSAAQIGFEDAKDIASPCLTRAILRRRSQAEAHAARDPLDDGETLAEGHEFKADIFAAGEKVAVTGISKGKGFAGVMKRYGWRGNKATHGASTSHRKPASGGGPMRPTHLKARKAGPHGRRTGDAAGSSSGPRGYRKESAAGQRGGSRRERRPGHDQEIRTLRRNLTQAGNHYQKSRWHKRGNCSLSEKLFAAKVNPG